MRAAVGTHRALNQDEATTTQDPLQAVLASDNLARAWKRVKSNKGAPGIDGVTVQDWPAHAREHWPATRAQIEQGRYTPQAVRRVEIPKPAGGKRLLGIPTVTDRVVQQAIAQVLTPIFDPTFADSIVRSERAAQRVMRSITRYLETSLKLTVNLAKSKVAPMSGCSFLGFTIVGKKIRWTDKSVAQFKHRVRELTGRSWGVSMDHRLHKLGQYVRGWTAYFGISQYYRPVPELDDWIRRRIRMCYWKQWRWVRTKIKHLLALGVSLKTAIQHGVSSKSYWHMARTPALQQALSNAWLKAQGLVSVKDLWCKAQGYTT